MYSGRHIRCRHMAVWSVSCRVPLRSHHIFCSMPYRSWRSIADPICKWIDGYTVDRHFPGGRSYTCAYRDCMAWTLFRFPLPEGGFLFLWPPWMRPCQSPYRSQRMISFPSILSGFQSVHPTSCACILPFLVPFRAATSSTAEAVLFYMSTLPETILSPGALPPDPRSFLVGCSGSDVLTAGRQ